MNNGSIVGRLVRDPELRFTKGSGKAVCSFTVAVNRAMSKDKADFIPVTVWGKTAENCSKYLSKGSQVGVTGSAKSGSYDDKDGNKKYTIDMLAFNVEFLSSNNSSQTEDKEAKKESDGQNDFNGFQAIDGDDDIPF